MHAIDEYSEVLGEQLAIYIYVAVTGRKRTLFHCKWANSIGYISIEITPDFLCPFMND